MPATTSTPRRRGPSIFARQFGLYLLLILLLAGLTGWLFLAVARDHLEDEIGAKLESVARIATRHTPAPRLALIRPGDDGSRMVRRMKQRLEEIREATGLRNLYVFRLDGSSLLDLDPEVPIGTVYPLPRLTPARRARLRAGRSVHALGPPGHAGRIRMSAFAPVADSTGALVAVVGLDAGARELEILDRMRDRLIWITAAAVAVAAAAALVLARSITRPVRHIAAVAERLGGGDYTARAAVHTGDEVEALATAINRMADQVDERDRALKEMAASVAHEVRNPLNSMRLLLRLLEQDLAAGHPEAQTQTLATLQDEIARLTRFTDEFLTWSRSAPPRRETVDPGDLALSVADLAAAEARAREVAVDCEVPAASPPLQGDRQRLEQALLNLVLNAVQASPDGARVCIRVQPLPDGGCEIAVEDRGPGVPDEVRERLFEPFFTTRAEGTGLGLANAARIAAEHGGTIDVASTGDGARFALRLPSPASEETA